MSRGSRASSHLETVDEDAPSDYVDSAADDAWGWFSTSVDDVRKYDDEYDQTSSEDDDENDDEQIENEEMETSSGVSAPVMEEGGDVNDQGSMDDSMNDSMDDDELIDSSASSRRRRLRPKRSFNILDLEPHHPSSNSELLWDDDNGGGGGNRTRRGNFFAIFQTNLGKALPYATEAFKQGSTAGFAFKMIPVLLEASQTNVYKKKSRRDFAAKLVRAARFSLFVGSSSGLFNLFARTTRVTTPRRPTIGAALLTCALLLASPRNRLPIALFAASRALETQITSVFTPRDDDDDESHDFGGVNASLVKSWIFSVSFASLYAAWVSNSVFVPPVVETVFESSDLWSWTRSIKSRRVFLSPTFWRRGVVDGRWALTSSSRS